MTKDELYKVLRRPHITEKANDLKDANNEYVFEVSTDANKIQVRQAIESLFNVKVSEVRTSIVRGKNKRVGRFIGRRPNWKKAFVTLKEGHAIDFFEGM
ncbi:MAG: 50S ribosomal protein L23 [Myxococcales bacterium]